MKVFLTRCGEVFQDVRVLTMFAESSGMNLYAQCFNATFTEAKNVPYRKGIKRVSFFFLVKKGESVEGGHVSVYDTERTNPHFIHAIESTGSKTARIIEIPDDVEWYLFENEAGYESIHEKHKVWS